MSGGKIKVFCTHTHIVLHGMCIVQRCTVQCNAVQWLRTFWLTRAESHEHIKQPGVYLLLVSFPDRFDVRCKNIYGCVEQKFQNE